jgi:peptide/nickel transport system substrate-binding protein
MTKPIEFDNLLKQGKISRREFIKITSALGVSTLVAPAFLPSLSHAAEKTPKKGGLLRLGLAHGNTTDTLDPATQNNAMSGTMYLSLSNTFVEIGPDGGLAPAIAESWEASPDAKTWTFKVRPGVEFHNGKTLDADDVVASINHHRKEDAKSGAKVLLKSITDIKKDGKNTLVISLDQPSADFPFMLADIHITMLPAKGDDVDWQSGVGTGAYMLESFEPGVRTALKRFPNHWNKDKGHFEQVEMLSIHDMAARTNALRTGRVDLIDRIDLKTVDLLGRVKGIKVNEITSLGHYAMPMNTGVAPFDNNDVRMALKYAIDREALLKTLFKGHGQLGNDQPISPANRYFAKELPQRKYDPDKAKFHLKKAGMENLALPLHAAGAAFPEAVDLAVLYKEYAVKAGITINVVREPNDGYWSDIWMKKPWCFCYWRGRPTEDWMFSSAYAADAKWNDTYWKHERFNKLLKEARSELKDAKRRELYAEMQRIVRDEGGQVIPLFNNYLLACNEKLEHGPMLRYADLDGYKLPERWWFTG